MDCIFFFFSSRRRHTRLQGDWSSDVCSSDLGEHAQLQLVGVRQRVGGQLHVLGRRQHRSEEHTSELQSPCNLVCRLLLEKKKTTARCHRHSKYRSVHNSSALALLACCLTDSSALH